VGARGNAIGEEIKLRISEKFSQYTFSALRRKIKQRQTFFRYVLGGLYVYRRIRLKILTPESLYKKDNFYQN
jgi:hypothetical protein